MSSLSFVLMYGDDSVCARGADGALLQLCACGAEFEIRLPSRERVRQRTRFTTSRYKALVTDVLNFRNKYAAHPYLPEELIPEEQKKKVLPAVTEVEWSAEDSWSTVSGSGEVIVRSVDGKAQLMLSGCGEEFTVEFMCPCSQNQQRSVQELQGHQHESPGSPPAGRRDFNSVAEIGRAHVHTLVVQHHSRVLHPHSWRYPLSLALRRWELQGPRCSDGQQAESEGDRVHASASTSQRAVKSHVPAPLPLTCPSPHLHTWRYGSVTSDQSWSELDMTTELVRIIWCHGVLYRVISGAVPVVEVSPGDGSVIRSNGVLTDYFTHSKPGPEPCTAVESVYYLGELPPDRPGQPYSLRSVVTRASRILQCYRQACTSGVTALPQCCWRRAEVQEHVRVMEEVEVAGRGHFQALSDGSAHATFLDGIHVQMRWDTQTSAQEVGLCQLTLPDGQQHLVKVDGGGAYHSYVAVVGEWCNWVKQTRSSGDSSGSTHTHTDQPINSGSVLAELEKIKRFNFLLENSSVLKSLRNPSQNCALTPIPSDLTISENSVSEALQKTSKAIQDINALLAQNL